MESFGFFYIPLVFLAISSLLIGALFISRRNRLSEPGKIIWRVLSAGVCSAALVISVIADLLFGIRDVADTAFLFAPALVCVVVSAVVIFC